MLLLIQEKHRFYNPIMQNNTHIAALRKQLKHFDRIPFYSIFVFYGECVLREIIFVTDGTYLVKSWRINEIMDLLLQKIS